MNKRRSAISIMAKLITLIKPLLMFMFIAILFGCLGFLCAIFIPILGTTALLTAIDKINILSIQNIFIILILIGIFRGIFRYIEQACNHYIAFKLLAVIRDKVFYALRKLAPAKLEGHNKGNLIALITSDIELLEVFYAHTISPIIIAIIISIFMIIFISRFSIYLGAIAAFAYIFVGAIIPIINSKQVADYGISYRNKAGKLNNIFLDSLRGLQELLQYNKTEQRLDEINKLSSSITYDYKKLKSKEIICRNITDTTVIVFNTIILITSIFLYYSNLIDFSSAVICVVSLLSSYGPVIALSNLSNSLAQTLASGERVLSLLEEKPVVNEITNGKNIDIYDIKCENLDFSYDNIKILDNINMTIPKNSITGILGKSGCGKSTLLKLIMRFWDRDSGKLTLSNTDIKDINTNCLRQNESYCTQDTYLFNDTIGNNIAIAKYNATKEEIINASKKASLHEFVSQLPMGYDTPIGELGDRLSGGEKQRIGIARAFLSNSNIILLDEPTSNLDSLNESIILKSLYSAKDKTIVLVSHRQSTLNIADTIYELKNKRQS